MFNTNFNPLYFQQAMLYPYGYQYVLLQQPLQTPTMMAQNILQCQYPQIQVQNLEQPVLTKEPIKKRIHSETQSDKDSESVDGDIQDTPNLVQASKNIQIKKSQKPNFLVKSTNIQKNYAKAIVSFACRQRALIFEILGENRAQEFLKLMNRLRNKLRNIAHITRFTHQEDFLSMFRILGNNFLRKDSVSYIYSSKIQQKSCHIANKAVVKNSLLKY